MINVFLKKEADCTFINSDEDKSDDKLSEVHHHNFLLKGFLRIYLLGLKEQFPTDIFESILIEKASIKESGFVTIDSWK